MVAEEQQDLDHDLDLDLGLSRARRPSGKGLQTLSIWACRPESIPHEPIPSFTFLVLFDWFVGTPSL